MELGKNEMEIAWICKASQMKTKHVHTSQVSKEINRMR